MEQEMLCEQEGLTAGENSIRNERGSFKDVELQSSGKNPKEKELDHDDFIDQMKRKCRSRLKTLKADAQELNSSNKSDADLLKKELDVVHHLDLKLQDLEDKASSMGTSTRMPKDSPLNEEIILDDLKLLRNERKQRRRQLRLRTTLEALDRAQTQSKNNYILRNIQLGPNARYYTLLVC